MASRLLTGLLLVVVGAVLLMNTTGYLPWTVWESAIRFWPVFLIGLGLQVATRNKVPGLAVSMVAIIILAAMFPYSAPSRMRSQGNREWTAKMLPGTSEFEITLEAPSLNVHLGGDEELAKQSEIALSAGMRWDKINPFTESGGSSDTAWASIRVPSDNDNAGKQEWDLSLHPSLTTSVDIVTAVSEVTADMTAVYLHDIKIASGVTSLELTLGLSGKETSAEIAAGVANVTLKIPEAAGVKITLSAPLSLGNDFAAEGLNKVGNTWSTPGFDNAETKVTLSVTAGAGRVDLRRTR